VGRYPWAILHFPKGDLQTIGLTSRFASSERRRCNRDVDLFARSPSQNVTRGYLIVSTYARRARAPATPGGLGQARIPQLDGLRGVAILLVIIWHYIASVPGANPLLATIFSLTGSSVDLFFVLSAFLLGGILLDHRESPNYFKVFYVRRIARILPLYSLWLILFAASSYLRFDSILPTLFAGPLPFWSYATFTQNFAMANSSTLGPGWLAMTWSLAVEEQFYLLLPTLIRALPPRRLPYFLVTCIVLAPVLRLAQASYSHSVFPNYVLLPLRADVLALGVFCAWLVRQPRSAQWFNQHPVKLSLRAGWILLLLGVGVMSLLRFGTRYLEMTIIGYTWLALFYALSLLIIVTPLGAQSPLGRLVSNSWLRRLGIISYSVYLFHQPALDIARALFAGAGSIPVTLLALAASLSLATCSWHFFEKRIVVLGHLARYRPTTVAGEASPVVSHLAAA
jgi:peptidoglycan/LPS O-acetylase OafA/YrhL